jgi:cysteinyl-tRNA synthetase
MLKVYNTMSGRKETFEPLVPGRVGMYACGVTVYDECHLGHARSALIFDVMRRHLQEVGYQVTYVRNFTDVDDKIIAKAAHEGVAWTTITARYLDTHDRDMARLGIIPADIQPKATEHIADIIALVDALIHKGHAYAVDGDVYYSVPSYPEYGRLSRRHTEELLAGARVEVDERKRSPLDFALWKSSKPGEPSWDSPWGSGRPGWHIECSAMAMHHLGDTFDLHGGGMDLIFPHHENEIAQSSAATGRPFAKYWVHNGFVEVNREKMSKSLGNFFTIREVFEKWPYREPVTGEALRYFLLATHYRSPLDFSDLGLQEAKMALDGLYSVLQRLDEMEMAAAAPGDAGVSPAIERCRLRLTDAMDDDFNTPGAIAALQLCRGDLNRAIEAGVSRSAARRAIEGLRETARPLGLLQLPVRDWEFQRRAPQFERTEAWPAVDDATIDRLVAERNEARHARQFARADEIRAQLSQHGITLEDRPDGTTRWKR